MSAKLSILLFFTLIAHSFVIALNPADVSITRSTSPSFTTDSNTPCTAGPRAAYIGFKVTNISGAAISNLRISLGTFLPAGTFGLAGGQAASQYIGRLAAGASDIVYWYVTYPCVHNTVCSVTATVSDTSAGVKTLTTTVTTKSSISASAGGLINSNIWGSGAVIGQIIYYDVTYAFGNAQVGDEYNIQPCGNLDFDASTFQFVNSQIISSVIPQINAGAKDSLYFIGGSQGGSGNLVSVRYYFQVMHSNSPGTYCRPYASQTSGTQVKYTGNYETAVISPSPISGAFPFTLSLSANKDNATACDTVNYTVVVRNTNSYASSYDKISVSLPNYMSYIGMLPESQVTHSMLSLSPVQESTGNIEWTGGMPSAVFPYKEFYIPANDSLKLIFNAKVSCAVPLNTLSTATAIAFAGLDSSNLANRPVCLNCLYPLPVMLTSFTGTPNKCAAVLQWKTSGEINADKFVVEQSSNGLNFTAVAEIRSANSSTGKAYQISLSQSTGTMYYRLKLLDKDGKFSYSPVVTVRTSCIDTDYLSVYPNPASTNVSVSFHTAYRGQANLVIFNSVGERIGFQKIQISSATNTINLDISNYPMGICMLYLANDRGEKIGEVQKVIKY